MNVASSRVEHDEGFVRLHMPEPKIFVSEVVGYVRAEDAQAFVEFGDSILDHHGTLCGFHDWTAVLGYTNEARLIVTEWSVRRMGKLEQIHIALKSPVIRMAVAVANIPLKGRITMHDTMGSLDFALRRASTRPPPPFAN